MNQDTINSYAIEIYKQNKERGWWDDPNRDLIQTIQLVVTEIAEATEGDRKNLMDDHLPHRKMVEVELADAMIRMLDLAGHGYWDYNERVDPHPYIKFARTLAAKHLWIVDCICKLADRVVLGDMTILNYAYSSVIKTMLTVAEQEGYDLQGAIDEKLEYNKKRADHDRENRKADGGKRY